MQQKHGYPGLTAERKRKILGLNALRPYELDESVLRKTVSSDRVSATRAGYRQNPDPHFGTFGPRNRREFMNLTRWTF